MLRVYRQTLQQQLSCVTSGILTTWQPGRNTLNPLFGLYLNNNYPVTLRASVPITLSVGQKFRIVRINGETQPGLQIVVAAYFYTLETPDGEEIVAYQYDPDGASRVKHPHLHVGRGATGNVTTYGPRGLHRIHFPTKHIELEDVLKLAITEFGVEARRDNWEQILS